MSPFLAKLYDTLVLPCLAKRVMFKKSGSTKHTERIAEARVVLSTTEKGEHTTSRPQACVTSKQHSLEVNSSLPFHVSCLLRSVVSRLYIQTIAIRSTKQQQHCTKSCSLLTHSWTSAGHNMGIETSDPKCGPSIPE